MNTAFLSALQNQSQTLTQQLVSKSEAKPIAKPVQPVDVLKVTIDLVVNRNRIDVFFSQKPSNSVLDSLRSNGFHHRPSDKAWYHQDNLVNRKFLNSTFDADLEIVEPVLQPEPKTQQTIVVAPPLPDFDSEEYKSPYNDSHYGVYRDQVDQLIQKLQIRPADLMLRAIDCLYVQVFGSN